MKYFENFLYVSITTKNSGEGDKIWKTLDSLIKLKVTHNL